MENHPAINDAIYFDLLRRSLLVVNRDGSVWRFGRRRFHVVKFSVNRQGYKLVRLRFDGRRRSITLHRLVWMAWNRKLVPDGCDVHHKDENNQNNDPNNLEPRFPTEHRANGTSFRGYNETLADFDEVPF